MARTVLAKTVTGAEAARVKRLEKPTAVAWAVNQVYWRARAVYDRVARAGGKLRDAQIASLKGKAADVRRAADDHRRAVTEAVADASRYLTAAGLHPDAESLARTFEALSVASAPAGHQDVRQTAAGRRVRGTRRDCRQAGASCRACRSAPGFSQGDDAGARRRQGS